MYSIDIKNKKQFQQTKTKTVALSHNKQPLFSEFGKGGII